MNSEELQAFAGITYRQLDYWCRSGYLREPHREPTPRQGVTTGSGTARSFTRAEAWIARRIKTLIDDGMPLPAAAEMVRSVTEPATWNDSEVRRYQEQIREAREAIAGLRRAEVTA